MAEETMTKSIMPAYAFTQGQAIEVLHTYLLEHENTLERDDKVALRWALLALHHVKDDVIKATISDFGLLFWAEVFSAEGGKCEYCEGGFCRKHVGSYCQPANECGYCYFHLAVNGLDGDRVCIKTERAVNME